MQNDYMYSNWLLRLITILIPPALWVWWAVSTGGLSELEQIPAWHFVLIALASFRLTRLFTLDVISEFIRGPFVYERSFRTPLGVFKVEQEARNDSALRQHIGEIISCYWCAGIWTSFALVAGYFYIPLSVYLPLLIFLAVAGSQVILESLSRFLSQGLRWFNRIPEYTGPQKKPKHHQAE